MTPDPFLPGFGPHHDAIGIDGAYHDLEHYPSVNPQIIMSHAKTIGLSGELFVDSLLIRHGLTVLPVPESMPFDRLICIDDRHVKIQIKTTTRSRHGYYSFTLQKGHYRSKRGVQRYASDDYDVAALVILPENVVFFSADYRSSHRIAVREVAFLRANPLVSFRRAIDTVLVKDAPGQDILQREGLGTS